jgi:hypothetical protein
VPAKKRSSAGPAAPGGALRSWTLDVPLALLLADPFPRTVDPPTRAPDAEVGRLALLLLDALGTALNIVPTDRRHDARRLLRLFAGLSENGPHPRLPGNRPLWTALAVLPDDQLDDVFGRARVAAALVDDPS